MNNQSDSTIALRSPDMSIDPLEEALSRLSHLSKERRKKATLQLLNQLQLADRTEIAQERSEEHTSELQSHLNLVCRLLLEKKNSIAMLQRINSILGKFLRVIPPPLC